MIIGCPHHFVINHGCHANEIKMMKIDISHLVTTSSFTNHMPIYDDDFLHIGLKIIVYD